MSTGYSSLFTSGLAPADSIDVPNADEQHSYHVLDGISVLDPPAATTVAYDHRYSHRTPSSTNPAKSSRPRHTSWTPFANKPTPHSFAPSFTTATSPANTFDSRSILTTNSRGYASTITGAHPGYAQSIGAGVAPDNASFISFKSSRSSKRNSSSFAPSFGAPVQDKARQSALTVLTNSNGGASTSYNVPPQTPPPHSALPSIPGSRSTNQNRTSQPQQQPQNQSQLNYYSSHSRKPSNASSSSRDKRKAKHTSLSFLSMSDSPLDVIPEPQRGRRQVDEEEEEDEGRSSPDTIIMQYSSRNTPTPTTATSSSSFAFARPATHSQRSPLATTPYSSYSAIGAGQYAYQEPISFAPVPVTAPTMVTTTRQSTQHVRVPPTPNNPAQRERTTSKLSKASSANTSSKSSKKDEGGGGMLSRLFSFSSRKGK